MNPLIAELADGPFQRLDALLEGIAPASGEPIVMSIGEPQSAVPPEVSEILTAHAADWARYAPAAGTDGFRRAAADYLARRFQLPPDLLDPPRHLTASAGTREGLFFAGLGAVPQRTADGEPPYVLLPNPFYHSYYAAAVISGARPVLLPAVDQERFGPDLTAVSPDILSRTALAYLCNPANPTGACASEAQLRAAIELARAHDFVLVVDECYSEIYHRAPPAGALQVAAGLDSPERDPFANLVVTHSLSKRSGVPGLRVGMVAGDPKVVEATRTLINWGGVAVPRPVAAAAEWLWSDDQHAARNRQRYRDNLDLANEGLGQRPGYVAPQAGFFLWLAVDDGEQAARRIWQQAAVKAMPGAFMARAQPDGRNPATGFLRLALVHDPSVTAQAIDRLATVI
ncbi:MAG: aminotransferase class I/II-fold pyridoxal phosphate-dependent enzyme [Alphaproteobacteria bacterium]|nr:aminotransferase class I/II-fold pyridoxal phosphate-dependent enzyme [Alphaproteobacteria bacterium]